MTHSIYPITIPKWGIEMQEGTVVCWHVDEGSELNRGDELIDVETDKIVNTMEAPASGVLRRCLAQKGDTLKVGALLGLIAPAEVAESAIDEFIAGFRPAESAVRKNEAGQGQAAPAAASAESAAPTASAGPREKRVRVSPAAAQRARELGVDISQVPTSGRRISPQDVERFAVARGSGASAEPTRPSYTAQPLSATRRAIARKLVEAKQQIPHFYLSMDIGMDAALQRRQDINRECGAKISVNDLVMRAAVLALQSLPVVNIHVVENEIRQFAEINLAMAVATERGLITPVIHAAEKLTLLDLASQAAALGQRARDGSLMREDLEGGTFTVSNLGMYGISDFQAIINPPQGAILSLGCCEERIVPTEGGAARTAWIMRCSLSCDHRAIDGAIGAQFLSQVKTNLESPSKL